MVTPVFEQSYRCCVLDSHKSIWNEIANVWLICIDPFWVFVWFIYELSVLSEFYKIRISFKMQAGRVLKRKEGSDTGNLVNSF